MNISQSDILDLQFIEARGKLLEVAAFLDRFQRAAPTTPLPEQDFRFLALLNAFREIAHLDAPDRARTLLNLLSDLSSSPLPKSTGIPACGAPRPH